MIDIPLNVALRLRMRATPSVLTWYSHLSCRLFRFQLVHTPPIKIRFGLFPWRVSILVIWFTSIDIENSRSCGYDWVAVMSGNCDSSWHSSSLFFDSNYLSSWCGQDNAVHEENQPVVNRPLPRWFYRGLLLSAHIIVFLLSISCLFFTCVIFTSPPSWNFLPFIDIRLNFFARITYACCVCACWHILFRRKRLVLGSETCDTGNSTSLGCVNCPETEG
jgi:hypothetical protein